MGSGRSVSVERVIAAPADRIFDILADPSRHQDFDGSDTVRSARGRPSRLALGSRFSMNMKMGVPYFISNKVIEFEENRRIAWRHFGRHVWRYELEPAEGGTLVRETFDWSTSLFPRGIELMGYDKSHPANMERTLERLDALVRGDSGGSGVSDGQAPSVS